jgi:hypothetical protein
MLLTKEKQCLLKLMCTLHQFLHVSNLNFFLEIFNVRKRIECGAIAGEIIIGTTKLLPDLYIG